MLREHTKTCGAGAPRSLHSSETPREPAPLPVRLLKPALSSVSTEPRAFHHLRTQLITLKPFSLGLPGPPAVGFPLLPLWCSPLIITPLLGAACTSGLRV